MDGGDVGAYHFELLLLHPGHHRTNLGKGDAKLDMIEHCSNDY